MARPPSPASKSEQYDFPGLGDRLTGHLNITLHPLERTFHPLLRITVRPSPTTPPPRTKGCYALISVALPDAVFIDRDELADRWGMIPSILRPARCGTVGSFPPRLAAGGDDDRAMKAWMLKPDIIDIERPVRTVPVMITNRLGEEVEEMTRLSVALELRAEALELEIPLHGRYLAPGLGGEGEREVIVFGEGGGEVRGSWLCAMSEDPDQIFAIPPAPHSTGSESKNSRHFHGEIPVAQPPVIQFDPSGAPMTLTLPVGHAEHQIPVEIITAVAIWLGWAYLVRKIWRFSRRAAAPVQRGELAPGETRQKVD